MDDEGKTTWIQKDSKSNYPSNDTLITCLCHGNNNCTDYRRNVYNLLVYHGLFLEEQKGFCLEARGTDGRLFIDQHIFKKAKTRRKMWL